MYSLKFYKTVFCISNAHIFADNNILLLYLKKYKAIQNNRGKNEVCGIPLLLVHLHLLDKPVSGKSQDSWFKCTSALVLLTYITTNGKGWQSGHLSNDQHLSYTLPYLFTYWLPLFVPKVPPRPPKIFLMEIVRFALGKVCITKGRVFSSIKMFHPQNGLIWG